MRLLRHRLDYVLKLNKRVSWHNVLLMFVCLSVFFSVLLSSQCFVFEMSIKLLTRWIWADFFLVKALNFLTPRNLLNAHKTFSPWKEKCTSLSPVGWKKFRIWKDASSSFGWSFRLRYEQNKMFMPIHCLSPEFSFALFSNEQYFKKKRKRLQTCKWIKRRCCVAKNQKQRNLVDARFAWVERFSNRLTICCHQFVQLGVFCTVPWNAKIQYEPRDVITIYMCVCLCVSVNFRLDVIANRRHNYWNDIYWIHVLNWFFFSSLLFIWFFFKPVFFWHGWTGDLAIFVR